MDNNEEILEGEFYTLTDDEGNESQFELIGTLEVDGETYLALVPSDEEAEDDDEDEEEYVILKREVDDKGEELLATIEDDEEFERIADMFDEEFANIDYDAEEAEEEEK